MWYMSPQISSSQVLKFALVLSGKNSKDFLFFQTSPQGNIILSRAASREVRENGFEYSTFSWMRRQEYNIWIQEVENLSDCVCG